MNIVNRLLILLMLISLAACAGRGEPRLPLNHDLGQRSEPSGNNVTLTIDAPVWLWDDKIRYRLLYNDASAVRYYNLDRWEAPLPALLERYLNRIESPHALKLRVALAQFEQRFTASNEARVVIELTVSAHCHGANTLLGSQRFSTTQATSSDAEGAINGFSALSNQLRNEIQAWLISLPNAKQCAAQSP
jgi:cholesterol transport system auxiliary component